MLKRGVPIAIILALTSFAVSAVSVALSPARPAMWSAAIALAILGGAIPMIGAINIRIIPVFSRRQWASASLLRLQLGFAIAGGWLVWLGRSKSNDPIEIAGHASALVGGLLLTANLALLFRSEPAKGVLPKPSDSQWAMDRVGILFSRMSVLFLLIGLAIGLWMTVVDSTSGRLDLAWAHALLVGYVLSTIAGVCYHVLGRWTDREWTKHSVRLARFHAWATAFALPLMLVALAFDESWLFMLAGPIEATALLLFLGLIAPFVFRLSMLSRTAIYLASLCLLTGVLLGAWFAGHPEFGPQFRMVHASLNLFGWVVLMISGVAYYLIPRMFGRPLRSPLLAGIQVAVSAGGVALLATGWAMRIRWQGPDWPIELGGIVVATGVGLLAINLGLTFRRVVMHPGTTAPLPFARRPVPQGTTVPMTR